MTLETSSAQSDAWEAGSGDVVYALAASPQFDRDGICFAGRASGLNRSADGGASWRPAYATLNLSEALSTSAVVVSPDFASDRAVFAGGDRRHLAFARCRCNLVSQPASVAAAGHLVSGRLPCLRS